MTLPVPVGTEPVDPTQAILDGRKHPLIPTNLASAAEAVQELFGQGDDTKTVGVVVADAIEINHATVVGATITVDLGRATFVINGTDTDVDTTADDFEAGDEHFMVDGVAIARTTSATEIGSVDDGSYYIIVKGVLAILSWYDRYGDRVTVTAMPAPTPAA